MPTVGKSLTALEGPIPNVGGAHLSHSPHPLLICFPTPTPALGLFVTDWPGPTTRRHISQPQDASILPPACPHRFILKNPKAASIVAFCLSPNRRYIALSEHLTEDDVVQVRPPPPPPCVILAPVKLRTKTVNNWNHDLSKNVQNNV